MKFIYILPLFLILFSCTETELPNEIIEVEQPTECDCNELILDTKYNRFYLTDKKQPFTGNCKTILADGSVKMERNYVEGKYQGDLIDYYENGQIQMIRQYKNHFINGFEKIYSRSGKLIKHSIYIRSSLKEVVEHHPEVSEND